MIITEKDIEDICSLIDCSEDSISKIINRFLKFLLNNKITGKECECNFELNEIDREEMIDDIKSYINLIERMADKYEFGKLSKISRIKKDFEIYLKS